MSDEKSSLAFFRTSLKAEVKAREAECGKNLKSVIADAAGITRAQLTEIAQGRRPGKEDVRRKIAKALNYDYEEFIKIGELLESRQSLDEARHEVYKARQLKFEPDGSIEKIAEFWNDLSESTKQEILNFSLNKWVNKINYVLDEIRLPKDRYERFEYIWKMAFSKYKIEPHYDKETFDSLKEYMSELIGDIEVYNRAYKRVKEEIFLSQVKIVNRSETSVDI